MDSSIIGFQEYVSVANWRRPEQLRGLMRNHPDLVVTSGPLAAPGNIFTSAQIALHDTENALAVAMSPFMGAGSVGLMSLSDGPAQDEPTLAAAARMRWLDLTDNVKTSSIEWCDDLLLLGSSRGHVIVADLGVAACHESSSLLQPCGALLTSTSERALSQITVSPSSYAASTLVRSVKVNTKANKASVVAVKGHETFVWDLAGGALPVRSWAPHAATADPSPVLFARWAPGSDSVVLTGSYDGTLVMVDTRCAGAGNGLIFGLRENHMCSTGDFSTVMPFALAASSSDGTFSIFDVRHTAHAIHTIPSLQGDVVALQWLKLQSDMLVTGGSDGSVSLWNLRQPPTYCVGRAQFQFPVTDLAATETFLNQRAFGITLGGELTLTGLKLAPMMALAPALDEAGAEAGVGGGGGGARAPPAAGSTSRAPPSSANMSFASGAAHAASAAAEEEREGREARACGLLYTRRLREGYELLCECAAERFAAKDSDRAMRLVSLIDINRTPVVRYDALLRARRTAAAAGDASPMDAGPDEAATAATASAAALSPEEARKAFEVQLLRMTSRLCTSVPLDRIRTLAKPDAQDLRKLESLRLNTLLHRVLATRDADQVAAGVSQALDLLTLHPESFELIDADVVSGIAALLLRKSFAEGERFVKALLSFLEEATTGSPAAVALVRGVLTTVQEPLVTAGLRTRAARRFEESFFRNMAAAKDAVLTQLELQRLGLEHHREVIKTMNAYLARCRRLHAPDMFCWLGVQPMIVFLRCLTADSNYVTFFWTCVQCIEAWASFPRVRDVESVLFEVVGRITNTGSNLSEDLDDLAGYDRFSVPLLRLADNSLRSAHDFLAVLLRAQFECENVALRSNMTEMPVVMARVVGVLNTVSEDLLDAWAGAIDSLMGCGQTDVVRKFCFTTVRDFSFSMEDLMDISAKGEGDERLNEILDVCDDFLDAVGRRR